MVTVNIRTITIGLTLDPAQMERQVTWAGRMAQEAKKAYVDYRVQTLRLATQPWENYGTGEIKLIRELEKLGAANGLDYISVGTTKNAKNIPRIYQILRNTQRVFSTAIVAEKTINYTAIRQAARVIKKLAPLEPEGFANLRFAVLLGMPPGSPFFPGAYHTGAPSFALGTENSDMLVRAFRKAGSIERATDSLYRWMAPEYRKLEQIGKRIASKEKIRYGGIDVSIAPSIKPHESIATAFEALQLGRFGEPGTLAAARAVTAALHALPIKRCGYSGLMLPVLEDYGLAKRNNEGRYNISNLLAYSAVCGTGLDTIPLPGNISEQKIEALLIDIAALSMKLRKPLSARLMPIPGKKAGQMTQFKFPYFVNSRIMQV